MDFIQNWVKKLITIMIITSLLEVILPNKNLQKTVRVIMGLFILFTLLNPILVLFSLDEEEMMAVLPKINREQEWQKIKSDGEEMFVDINKRFDDIIEFKYGKDVVEEVSLKLEDGLLIKKIVIKINKASATKINQQDLINEMAEMFQVPIDNIIITTGG